MRKNVSEQIRAEPNLRTGCHGASELCVFFFLFPRPKQVKGSRENLAIMIIAIKQSINIFFLF